MFFFVFWLALYLVPYKSGLLQFLKGYQKPGTLGTLGCVDALGHVFLGPLKDSAVWPAAWDIAIPVALPLNTRAVNGTQSVSRL